MHKCPSLSPQTQPADWDDGSHGSSEEDDFEEEDETPIAPVSELKSSRVHGTLGVRCFQDIYMLPMITDDLYLFYYPVGTSVLQRQLKRLTMCSCQVSVTIDSVLSQLEIFLFIFIRIFMNTFQLLC